MGEFHRQRVLAFLGAQVEVARLRRDELGSGNKLADLPGVSRPYLHRVLSGQRPISRTLIAALRANVHQFRR